MRTAIYCRVSTEGQNGTEQACKLNWKLGGGIARFGCMKPDIN